MAPSWGTVVVLLLMVCQSNTEETATHGTPVTAPGFITTKFCPKPPPSSRSVAKSLMMKCLEMGHHIPMMMRPKPSDSGSEEDDEDTSYDFQSLLSSVPGVGARPDTSRGAAAQTIPDWMNMARKIKIKVKCKRNGRCKIIIVSRNDDDGSAAMKKMTENMWNCTDLPAIIKMMKNDTGPSKCFGEAFLAPLSWAAVTGEEGSEEGMPDGMDPADYEELVQAAKPLLQNRPPPKMQLPRAIRHRRMMKMMEMLNEAFGSFSEGQRLQVRDWVRKRWRRCRNGTRPTDLHELQEERPTRRPPQDWAQGSEKPTRRPPRGPPGSEKPTRNPPSGGQVSLPGKPPRPRPPGMTLPLPGSDACPPKLIWMKMMGRFLSRLDVSDIKSIDKDQLCEFFSSEQFRASFSEVKGMRPMLARRFLRRLQECSANKTDFLQRLDRLGSLACYYEEAPRSVFKDPDLSSRLLSQLDDCPNSGARKLRKRLVKAVMAAKRGEANADTLRSLGSGVTALSPKQLGRFPADALKEALGKLGPKFRWRANQARKLAKKLLQGTKQVSGSDLLALGSAIRGVKISTLREVISREELDSEQLRNISDKLSRGQRKALLESMGKGVSASEMVSKAPGELLSSISLTTLDKAQLTSLDQVEGKTWSRPQAAFLAKKLLRKTIRPRDIRKLGSAIQGMVCKMIDRVAEDDAVEMAQIMTENPRWLSRAQVSCAARKLFSSLLKDNKDYFQSITEEQLDEIPTMFLIRLPPRKIMDLPDSVCPTFLDKMSEANLTALPLRSLSRRILTKRALSCLTNGSAADLSALSGEDMLRLGPLLCEVPPKALSRLGQDVLNVSLTAMASCAQIPPRHRRELLQLLNNTYGDPSDWSSETMESLGPLLLLDSGAVRRLRYRAWLKKVLLDLKDSWSEPSGPSEFQTGRNMSALKEKLFDLAVNSPVDSEQDEDESRRRRRRRRSEYDDYDSMLGESELGGQENLGDWWPKPPRRKRDAHPEPTAQLIEELGDANALWSTSQLSSITKQMFEEAVETLGSVTEYSLEQLSVLRNKTLQAWGEVSSLSESQVMDLGCISRSFSPSELENMNVTSADTLEALAACPWTQEQVRALWRSFSQRAAVRVSELSAVDLSQLEQFICGLSPGDVLEINNNAFKEAVDSLGQLWCGPEMMQALKQQSLTAFGPPSNWSEAVVSTLGNIMASLSPVEMSSVDPDVFSYLRESSIPLIPEQTFNALSLSQLQALGPDNIAMVTVSQRSGLSQDKLDALDSALEPDVSRTDDPGPDSPQAASQSVLAGAPSVLMEGTLAWGKAALCLVFGLLLL